MKCVKCGNEIPVGSGFCPYCGNMISMMDTGTFAQQGIGNQNSGIQQMGTPYINNNTNMNNNMNMNKPGIKIAFFSLIALILCGVGMIIVNLNQGKGLNSKQQAEMVANEEAILGYWESSSGVRVEAMLRNILIENDVSEKVVDVLLKMIDIPDDDVKLALYFKDDQTVRVAINGYMIGKEDWMTYELAGNTRMIIKCDKITLADLSDLNVNVGGFGVGGIGAKLEIPEISHTFEYSLEDDQLKLKILDEKVQFEKEE